MRALTIARRELYTYLRSPLGSAIIAAALIPTFEPASVPVASPPLRAAPPVRVTAQARYRGP